MKRLLKLSFFAFFLTASLIATGCTETEPIDEENVAEENMEDDAMMEEMIMKSASVVLSPTDGNTVQGTVNFTETADGIRVAATITGLTPGEHGFHVHENGSCDNNGEAAGGHFSPQSHPHGAPTADVANRHAGDLGNIEADDDGNATYNRLDAVLALDGPNSIVGKAFIVHAGMDDLTSQPTGAAGARVACGIIEVMEDDMMMDTGETMDEDGEMEDGM